MTPETRKTLLGLISEYGDSLTRIQAEKEFLSTAGEAIALLMPKNPADA